MLQQRSLQRRRRKSGAEEENEEQKKVQRKRRCREASTIAAERTCAARMPGALSTIVAFLFCYAAARPHARMHLGKRLLTPAQRKKMMSGIALWCPLFDAVTDRSLDMSAVEMVSSFLGAGVFKTLRAAFDDSISELCASAMDDEESSVVDRDVVKHTALCSVLMITSCIRHIMSSKSLRGSSTGEELINGVVSSFCPDSSMFAFLEKTLSERCAAQSTACPWWLRLEA